MEIRMNKKIMACLGAVVWGMTALPALASESVVWDWSPAATGGMITGAYGNSYSNVQTPDNPWVQYFADEVSFANDTLITGMDIYGQIGYGAVNDAVLVTIWDNTTALVPSVILDQFSTTITSIDNIGADANAYTNRMHADFSGFSMLAGHSYWIGMTGETDNLTQVGLSGVAGGDGQMAQFGSCCSILVPTGDMSFSLYSNVTAVPLPPAAMLFGLGLSFAGFVSNRRRRVVVQ
jgi:hypothetical protein